MNNPRLLTAVLAALLSASGAIQSMTPVKMSLQDIFETAEANSAQLRPFITAQEEARLEAESARNGRLPEINANLSLSYIGDGFTTKRNFSDYQRAPIPHLGTGAGVNINQPVYTGGALTASIEMAKLKTSAARYAADFQRDNIRFQLTGYYLDIYKYTSLRQVIAHNISLAEKVVDQMQSRYSQGTALRNDITRYELLLSNYRLELIKIDNLIKILSNNLSVTAGLPDSTVIEPDSSILVQALPAHSEAKWQEDAYDTAPSIKLARNGIEMSRQAEKMVRADRLPKVSIQAGWTLDGPILVEIPPINRNLSYWYAGVGISYNLSSLYKSKQTVARSRVATLHAQEQLDAERERLSMAIRADYIKYLEAYEELKTQEKSVELAESNYRVTSTRYGADMALITDMLDAANAQLAAQQQLVDARINIIYYYYKLLFTSGKI